MAKRSTKDKTIAHSYAVTKCQNCHNKDLHSVFFVGYLPPVNKLIKIGATPEQQPSYPAQMLYCDKCKLVQLGLVVDPVILFPKEYPYTSGTTKVLRDNFSELSQEVSKLLRLNDGDLIVDIGSNDGTLLSNFKQKFRVLGVTPEDIGKAAIQNGIPTILKYFDKKVVLEITKKYGRAKLVTAANVFAHIDNVHDVIRAIKSLMTPDGVFISESHYLLPLINKLQYDTIYHEHLRYYSLASLKILLEGHGLEVFHAKNIPSHGGSIRVYAAKKGTYKVLPTVKKMMMTEKDVVTSKKGFANFKRKAVLSKLALHALLLKLKKSNRRIYGISAPSRASTLINYVGLDQDILDCVLEIKGSYKTGYYVPGTLIPILDEEKLFNDQPDYALLLSWHIASELMPKLKAKGFKGDFIVPLPIPKIIKNREV